MNDSNQRNDQIDTSASIKPENTTLVVGPGIVIKGNILSELEDPDVRMLILGRIEGDITTKGIVQIAKGGEVAGNSLIDAGTVIVSGSITGDAVTVRAKLLVLQSTGRVAVGHVRLPPGGLEQQRGSVLEARLSMSADVFAPVQEFSQPAVSHDLASTFSPTHGETEYSHVQPSSHNGAGQFNAMATAG